MISLLGCDEIINKRKDHIIPVHRCVGNAWICATFMILTDRLQHMYEIVEIYQDKCTYESYV